MVDGAELTLASVLSQLTTAKVSYAMVEENALMDNASVKRGSSCLLRIHFYVKMLMSAERVLTAAMQDIYAVTLRDRITVNADQDMS